MKLDRQIVPFAISGGLGFVVDTAVLYGAMALGAGFYLGRALSFMAAASFTWIFNRSITFTRSAPRHPSFAEWFKYVVAMSVGGAVNYLVSAWSYHHILLVLQFPVLAVAAGSMAGLAVNFLLAKRLIFNSGER
jgi:putative flippase GtrA